MDLCYIDIHIHTSENANSVNVNYDVDKLKEKITSAAKGHAYLISLTDHNTINYEAYKKMIELDMNFIVGVELHVKNYDGCPAYHCHFFFNIKNDVLDSINKLNGILDNLYPDKLPEKTLDTIPNLGKLINSFEGYEYLILPHGGQSHATFDTSIPHNGDIKFDNVMQRSIYYNMFDGFTARSNDGLEETQSYFQRLGISEFVNLVTCSDNYEVDKYPDSKNGDKFIPTWMYSSATFNGFRVALSEKMRFSYGEQPIENWQEQIIGVSLNNEKIDINVKLEPGLNVVIGNSSSGKTLFVDSIYKKINNLPSENYDNFGVSNMVVNNPSGINPHYFSQNYILDLIKKDDENGSDNSLSNNEFLKSIFPLDKEFVKTINESLLNLRSELNTLVTCASNLQSNFEKLSAIQNFTRLIYEGNKVLNPIEFMLPSKDDQKKITISDKRKSEIDTMIQYLSVIPSEIAFCDDFDAEILSIKKKLSLAFEKIEFAKPIENLIIESNKEEFEKLKELNERNAEIDESVENLLQVLEDIKENLDLYYKTYNKIINYSVEVQTKSIISAGHTLYIKNNFKLSKDIFIQSLNKYIKVKVENRDVKYTDLFSDNHKKNPKVSSFDDLANKIYDDISKENKVNYEIIHKDGRNFSVLSPGMRASVLLDIILGYNDDKAPLIIDQPEDNLATSYINHDLVDAIKKCKKDRQIIIVSHNATIPMLGDAQCIIACSNDGSKIEIRSYKLEDNYNANGSILDLIAEVTDGGKSSIKKRFKKYNLKDFR